MEEGAVVSSQYANIWLTREKNIILLVYDRGLLTSRWIRSCTGAAKDDKELIQMKLSLAVSESCLHHTWLLMNENSI